MPPSDPPATAASRVDAELVEERALGAHHVGDGDDREVRPVGPAGRRVRSTTAPSCRGSRRAGWCRRRRSGRCRTPCRGRSCRPTSRGRGRAVPSRSSAREAVAGALRRRRRREAGRVRVAAERVADQDDVVARRRQRAVGLVGDADRVQLPPAVERAAAPAGRGTASRPCRRSRRRSSARRRGHARDHIAVGWRRSRSRHGLRDRCMIRSIPMRDSRTSSIDREGLTMAHDDASTTASTSQALLDAREALKGAPEAAKFTWRASCKWQNGTHSQTDGPGLLRPRRGAEAQDRVLVRRRPSGGLRLRGPRRHARSSTCSSAWRAA